MKAINELLDNNSVPSDFCPYTFKVPYYQLNWRRLINRFGIERVEKHEDRIKKALDNTRGY